MQGSSVSRQLFGIRVNRRRNRLGFAVGLRGRLERLRSRAGHRFGAAFLFGECILERSQRRSPVRA